MNTTALPNTAACTCPADGGCGRLIPEGTDRCAPCDAGVHLHYGDQALALEQQARANAEAKLAFLRGVALHCQLYGDVDAGAWKALLAAALGDYPKELQDE
jgi:hypothetical protein